MVAVFWFDRTLVEQMLQDTTEDLRLQCSRVEHAFSLSCESLIEAKTQLEMKLAQVAQVPDSLQLWKQAEV